jgi:hypothetical protein
MGNWRIFRGVYMEVSGFQMMLGLALGVIVLIFLVLKTKIHVFLALIIAASITGLVGGMAAPDVVNAIIAGFGTTLGSIGIVIGFGVMMGRILEVSGAAEKMAYTIVKWLGKRKEEWAMAITGYIVSIPIFVDSAFVILTPLVKALSKKTGKSVLTLGVALGVGLVATHHAVPPTPGPLGVAGIFGVDVGLMAIWGLIFAIPIIIIGVFYAKWLGKKIYQIPDETGLGYVRPGQPMTVQEYLESKEEKNLPSLTRSLLPIVVPILLIFANTTFTAFKLEGGIYNYIKFIGSPVIAVGIGLIFAIYGLYSHVKQFFLTRHLSLRDAIDQITTERVHDYLRRCTEALHRLGIDNPKIAVAGLNPHSGENGLFGREELDEIKPGIERACKEGMNAVGPVPADSVFHHALHGKYDAVLSLYHDQGYIAAKMTDFERTISITNGLPFLRTSVDHGTAFDIAGKGIAGSVSMEECIKLAAKYAKKFRATQKA